MSGLLRGAVLDYSRALRRAGMSIDTALETVDAAILDSARLAGAPELLASVVRAAEQWVDEVYCVA